MPRQYPLDPAFAREFKDRRRAAGLSQNDVALAVGLAEATIGKYERMAAPVSPQLRTSLEAVLAEAERKVAVL